MYREKNFRNTGMYQGTVHGLPERGVLMTEKALFFYRHLHAVNGIGCQNRHFKLSFCIGDKFSHDFPFIISGQFNGMIHSEISAV